MSTHAVGVSTSTTIDTLTYATGYVDNIYGTTHTATAAVLVEPPNKGHFGDSMNSADLFFVERFSSLGGSKCIVGIILGP